MMAMGMPLAIAVGICIPRTLSMLLPITKLDLEIHIKQLSLFDPGRLLELKKRISILLSNVSLIRPSQQMWSCTDFQNLNSGIQYVYGPPVRTILTTSSFKARMIQGFPVNR